MINNTNVENNHVTTGDAKTVYPITFGGATDSGGLPMFKVTLTYADGSSKELVHNVDYKLVYNEVQENNTESLNKPSLIGIKFLLDEYLVAGNKLDIVRVTPFEQQIDFQIGRIDPEQVEKAFDASVMRDQELRNQIEQTAEDVAELTSDMADVDATLKTKASKEELADAVATLNTKVDSEVSDIESKIPESASATNPLVTEAYLGDNAVKKIGDTMTGALSFDVPGTAGKSKGLIYAKTASGTAALIGAKTDDNGVLRDVAVIPKLQTEALQSSQIYASFIGDSSTPVTRIHAKKIGSGPLRSMLTIPDEAGTIARLEDVQEVDNKLAGKQNKLTAGDNIIISGDVISAIGTGGAGLDMVVVDQLPETGQKGVLYFIKKDGAAPDVHDEYVWIERTQTFELIGSTKVDLSDYLPLSGGTITGPITLGMTGDSSGDVEEVDILKSPNETPLVIGKVGSSGRVLTLGVKSALVVYEELLPLADVGQSFSKVPRIYVEKINNGTDLSIPTQGDSLLANNSTASRAIATGLNATATQGGTAIGADSQAGSYAVAVGDLAKATGKRSVQLGKGTNADAGTLKFGNDSGNYTVLDVNGIVPAERMSSTAGTTGQVLTKTDAGMEWQEAPASGTKVIIKRYN